MKTERKHVYVVIDGEREYQEQRWPRPEHNHSVTEYLVYMRHYIEQAMVKVSTQSSDHEAKHDVRKIAALAVACMEENGARERTQCRRCKRWEGSDLPYLRVLDGLCLDCYHDDDR